MNVDTLNRNRRVKSCQNSYIQYQFCILMMQSHWFRHAVTGSITTRSGRGTGHDRLTDSRLQRIFCGPERVKWIENELALWMRRSAKLVCPRTWLFGSVAEKQGHLSDSQERKQNVTRIKHNPFDGPALRLILQESARLKLIHGTERLESFENATVCSPWVTSSRRTRLLGLNHLTLCAASGIAIKCIMTGHHAINLV